MRKIFVTGAAGMIGSAVCEMLLSKGYSVVATDNQPAPFEHPEMTYVKADLTDKVRISDAMKGCDTLIHLACTCDNDFPDVLSSEEEKFSSAVDKYLYKTADSLHYNDILLLSTYQVYAQPKTREPVRESAPEKPTTIYGKIKLESEKALESALKRSNTKGVIMRICPIYTKEFFINLKSKVYDTKDECVFLYGYGDYGYSFTCLYNLTDFIYGILTCKPEINYTGLYNVVDTKPTMAKDIVERLKEDMNISIVMQRSYGSDNIKIPLFGGSKEQKTNYRYNDVSIACSNISYDNTRAQRISTFRWKMSNTK